MDINETPDSLAESIARLKRMALPALQRLHRSLFGTDPAILHSVYLRRKILWHLQARAAGGLADEARQQALALAVQTTLRIRARSRSMRPRTSTGPLDRNRRLPPPGTILRRDFKGRAVLVKVLATGFEYEGCVFASLTAIANTVTGGNWNGFVFFRLNEEAQHGRRR